jgi:hypothetical protein
MWTHIVPGKSLWGGHFWSAMMSVQNSTGPSGLGPALSQIMIVRIFVIGIGSNEAPQPRDRPTIAHSERVGGGGVVPTAVGSGTQS